MNTFYGYYALFAVGDGRRRNLDNFHLFSQKIFSISIRPDFQYLYNTCFIIPRIDHFQKKQTGAKSTNSQLWLIPFRKIRSSKLTLQEEGNLINLVLIQGQ